MSEAIYYDDHFEGPINEHDGEYDLIHCKKCGRLTGMSGPLCMPCGNICHCAKCNQMRADEKLAIEVEQKLEGTWKPTPSRSAAPAARRRSRSYKKKPLPSSSTTASPAPSSAKSAKP